MSLKDAVRMARLNTRITPKLQAWLTNHPEGVKVTDPAIMKKVEDILTGVSKSRAGAFHPSQLYQCPRAQVYGYYDVPTVREFNPQLQNIFNDGHFRHLRWQVTLLEAGILTDVEVPVYDPVNRIEGSMDGVNTKENWMFELKGTSQFKQVQRNGALPAHIKQVHAYLFVSGIPEAIIMYEDKSNQQWHEITIHRDDKIIDEIKDILSELNYSIDNDQLPQRYADCENQTGSTYNSCPYASVCHRLNKPSEINPPVPNKRRPSKSQ
jgi:hypothetical protein